MALQRSHVEFALLGVIQGASFVIAALAAHRAAAFGDVGIGFGVLMALGAVVGSRSDSTIAHRILSIVGRRPPAQVADVVIRWVIVPVQAQLLLARANERFQDQMVNQVSGHHAVTAQMDFKVPVLIDRFGSQLFTAPEPQFVGIPRVPNPPIQRPHTTVVADLIQPHVTNDRSPFFHWRQR